MPSYELDLYKFEGYNTQVLGISIDHVPCLVAWAESLGGISYPLLSDFWPHGETAKRYGVFREDGRSERALFIVDKEGIIRYIDVHDIDEQPDNEELFSILRQMEPAAEIEEPVQTDEIDPVPGVPGSQSVVLYCRPGCIDCRLSRRFLERNGIAYTEINVREDPAAEAQVKAWTGGQVISPVFDINGTIVVDFKRSELMRLLGLD
jgi:arsenate reductase-like glutaredoxin family protein